MNQGERTVLRIKAFHVYAEMYAECIMYAEMKKSKNIFSGEAVVLSTNDLESAVYFIFFQTI